MKIISIVIPTYNEQENIPRIYGRICGLFSNKLKEYDYRILFVDNYSQDSSREIIHNLAEKDRRVQYIFNVKNFGFSRSTFYALTQAEGDCAILLFADMQDPPELIEDFLREWESGYKVVVGIKNRSKENKLMYFIRSIYYNVINKITTIDHINQFTGFGLYDRMVLDVFKNLHDPLPYLRGIVSELAPECKKVFYEQEKRKYGKSSFNFMKLYDVAMLGITSYSNVIMRMATFLGFGISLVSIVVAIATFFMKILNLIEYPIGTAALIIGVFFIGSIQLMFIGILGEYISNINTRVMDRPLVIEEKRMNLEYK